MPTKRPRARTLTSSEESFSASRTMTEMLGPSVRRDAIVNPGVPPATILCLLLRDVAIKILEETLT
jgi:hypothetical protein